MKSKQTRIFIEEKKQFRFDNIAFRSCLDGEARKRKVTKGQIAEEIASKLYVSTDAIKNWKSGNNGPASLELIKKAAEVLHTDWHLFVVDINGGAKMGNLTERQKNAVKRIYDVLIWFLEVFNNTDGFNNWWVEFHQKGSKNPEMDILERIDRMEDRVRLVMNQEFFDLHDLEIYDALLDYSCLELVDIYDGKTSYAYRFEAIVDGNPSTWEDYEKALKKLNEIITSIGVE